VEWDGLPGCCDKPINCVSVLFTCWFKQRGSNGSKIIQCIMIRLLVNNELEMR